jgi:hypothetical protein
LRQIWTYPLYKCMLMIEKNWRWKSDFLKFLRREPDVLLSVKNSLLRVFFFLLSAKKFFAESFFFAENKEIFAESSRLSSHRRLLLSVKTRLPVVTTKWMPCVDLCCPNIYMSFRTYIWRSKHSKLPHSVCSSIMLMILYTSGEEKEIKYNSNIGGE